MEQLDIILVKERLRSVQINCIKKRIRERGLSQKWVAIKLNKTTNTLNGWCSNKVQPHLIDLCLLSVVLNCHVKDLLGDIDVHHLLREQIG